MIWRNRPYTTSPLAVTAALLLLICGCGQVMSHFLARRPSRPGTWTGRLVSVTTRSGDEEYPALALDVESGPRSLSAKDDALALPPDRDVVLLCRGQGIIDPEELRSTDRIANKSARNTARGLAAQARPAHRRYRRHNEQRHDDFQCRESQPFH